MLCEQVDGANDVNALARIMPHIGIDLKEMQSMIKCKIQEMDTTAARKAYYNVMSMESLLPIDSLQHILSFYHFNEIKTVSKAFKVFPVRCIIQ